MSSKASTFFTGLATIIIAAVLLTVVSKVIGVVFDKYIAPVADKAGDAVVKAVAPETHALIERERERAGELNSSVYAKPNPAMRALSQKLKEADSTTPLAEGYQPPSQ